MNILIKNINLYIKLESYDVVCVSFDHIKINDKIEAKKIGILENLNIIYIKQRNK